MALTHPIDQQEINKTIETSNTAHRGPEWIRLDSMDGNVVWRRIRVIQPVHNQSRSRPPVVNSNQSSSTTPTNELQGNALSRHALDEATRQFRDNRNVTFESLMTTVEHAECLGRSDNTVRSQGSHLSYWVAYLRDSDTTDTSFNTTYFRDTRDETDVRRREHETLCDFACYIVCKPRQRNKTKNRAEYAKVVVGTVRTFYLRKTGRWPGIGEDRANSTALKLMFKGLEKFAPTLIKHRLPVMQHHLRAIKPLLDLENSHIDRSLWALWLCQWQGVMRSADLLQTKEERENRGLDPDLDTHRGRLRKQVIRDGGICHGMSTYVMKLKPIKTTKPVDGKQKSSWLLMKTTLLCQLAPLYRKC